MKNQTQAPPTKGRHIGRFGIWARVSALAARWDAGFPDTHRLWFGAAWLSYLAALIESFIDARKSDAITVWVLACFFMLNAIYAYVRRPRNEWVTIVTKTSDAIDSAFVRTPR